MSQIAFDRSVLANASNSPLASVGVQDPVRATYRGVSGDDPERPGTPRELVGFGAASEDTPTSRSLSHFFDPQNGGRGLIVGIQLGEPSPDWILEDLRPNPFQINSYTDARDYYYGAIVSADPKQRERSLVLMLESLGSVIHHLQDMAQPAHVRNDQHLPGTGDLFEFATEEKRRQLGSLPSGQVYGAPTVDLSSFDTARKFWVNGGRGIAEFASRNFVSRDTNFRESAGGFFTDPQYPLPEVIPCLNRPLVERRVATDADLLGPGYGVAAELWFVSTPIRDRNINLSGAETDCNARTSTYSVFDEDLVGRGMSRQFTLNRFTWAAAHEVLIPRAIAYSAGFINHFFRGRLRIDDASDTAGIVTLIVRNVSAGNAVLADRTSGGSSEFEVWYESTSGTRQQASVSVGDDLGSGTFAAQTSRELRFVMPGDVDSMQPRPFVLVFRGRVGAEEGVIGQVFGVTPRGFVVTPNYIPADGLSGSRSISFENGQWQLLSRTDVAAGNVDWKGNRVGDVVTWDGPQSRYFYSAAQSDGVSANVYMGGRLLSRAPANVLGAAIGYSTGSPELMVATYSAGMLQIFVRPLRSSYSNDALFDSVSNPTGWRRISTDPIETPSTPLFFNSSATMGQMMVDSLRARVRVTVAGASVAVERLGSLGRGTRTQTFAVAETILLDEPCLVGTRHTSSLAETVDWAERTIACVDYRGDQEVTCRIDSDPGLIDQGQAAADLAPPGTPFFLKSFSEASRTTSTRRVLSVGGLSIPLQGETSVQASNHRYEVVSGYVTDTHANNIVTTSFDTRILYLDARNDIATYELRNEVNTYNAVDRLVEASPNVYENEQTVTRNRERRVNLVADVRGATQSLAARVDPISGSTETNRYPYQEPRNLLACSSRPVPSNSSGSRPPVAFDDGNFPFAAHVHSMALEAAPTQGYGVDTSGNIAASQAIWLLQPDESYVRLGTWNFLQNGDLIQVLPGALPDPTYYPIGVIR